MRTHLKFAMLLVFIVLSQSLPSQTKRKAVSNPKVEKPSLTFTEKIFGANMEDAMLMIDEEFSSMDIVFDKVKDEIDYLYDDELKKTDSINHYFKHLISKERVFTIVGNKDREILELTVRDHGEADSTSQKILKKLGIEKWILIEKKGNRSLYENDKLFARITLGSTKIYEIFKPRNFPQQIHLDSLNVHHSFTENIDFARQMLEKSGFRLLAAKTNEVVNDNEYNFHGYRQELIYDKGTEVFIEMDDRRKNVIKISNPNAVIFSSLKNLLLDDQYKERYTDNEDQVKYFRKDNMMAAFSLGANEITFYAVPSVNDYQTKKNYGNFPYLYELEKIYKGFTFEDRIAYMTDHFAVSSFYKTPTFTTQKAGATFRYVFYNDKDFADHWGVKYAIDYDNADIADLYYKNMVGRFEELASSDFTLDVAQHQLSNRIQIYDKAVNSAMAAGDAAKRNAQLLADQRAEAEQKQRDIAREQEKARKNAELTQTLNSATTEILKLLQK